MRTNLVLFLALSTHHARASGDPCACLQTSLPSSGPNASCTSAAAPGWDYLNPWPAAVAFAAFHEAAATTTCGLPYLTEAVAVGVSTKHPLYWTVDETALFMFVQAETMGVARDNNPNAHASFSANDVDGPGFMALTQSDLTATLGLTLGSAQRFLSMRSNFVASFSWPPSDVLGMDGARHSTGAFDIHVSMVVERLLRLDVVAFEFELELIVVLTWEDAKIFKACVSAGVGGFDADDPCGSFWQPKLMWPNVIMDPHPSATLEAAVLEDFGLTTMPGANAVFGGGDPPFPRLNTSIAQRGYRVRGTFRFGADYHDFPRDWQQLNVSLQLPADMPLSKARLVPHALAEPTSAVAGPTDLPLWVIRCASAVPVITDYGEIIGSMLSGSGDPMSLWMGTLSPEEFAAISMTNPDETRWSAVTLTVHVRRLSLFYFYNFVLVVVLLVLISFASLFLSPTALDSRLGLTLTIVLGLQVFQIVIIDNMPETGYLTPLHEYTLGATFLVVMVALENLLVHVADRRHTQMLAVSSKLSALLAHKPSGEAATVMQRMTRGFLARKAKEADEPAKPGAPSARSETRVFGVATPKVAPAPTGQDGSARLTQVRSKVVRRLSCKRLWHWSNGILDRLVVFSARYLDTVSGVAFPVAFAIMSVVIFPFEASGPSGTNPPCPAPSAAAPTLATG